MHCGVGQRLCAVPLGLVGLSLHCKRFAAALWFRAFCSFRTAVHPEASDQWATYHLQGRVQGVQKGRDGGGKR